ncbi:hypothetical protein MTO96_019549 [Rhipicephalus appendiculatus]
MHAIRVQGPSPTQRYAVDRLQEPDRDQASRPASNTKYHSYRSFFVEDVLRLATSVQCGEALTFLLE